MDMTFNLNELLDNKLQVELDPIKNSLENILTRKIHSIFLNRTFIKLNRTRDLFN